MKKLFHLIFFGHYCEHTWEIIEKITVEKLDLDNGQTYPTGIEYVSKCTKCGVLKSDTFWSK